jgi:hypothetical protein
MIAGAPTLAGFGLPGVGGSTIGAAGSGSGMFEGVLAAGGSAGALAAVSVVTVGATLGVDALVGGGAGGGAAAVMDGAGLVPVALALDVGSASALLAHASPLATSPSARPCI